MSKVEGFWRGGLSAGREIKEEIEEGIETVKNQDETENDQESIDPMFEELESTSDFYEDEGDEGVDEVYDWYQKAIRRRDREPLDSYRFKFHFFREGSTDRNFMFGDKKRGYILGMIRRGVFVPTHFAPKSLRGGYMLMKELGASENTPAVMAITEDLAETLKKMPEWHDTEMNFPMYFRGEIHQKYLFYNSHPDIESLLPDLMQDYLEESENVGRSYYEEDEDDWEEEEESNGERHVIEKSDLESLKY